MGLGEIGDQGQGSRDLGVDGQDFGRSRSARVTVRVRLRLIGQGQGFGMTI